MNFNIFSSRRRRKPRRVPAQSDTARAKRVRCPHCHAAAGAACRTPAGKPAQTHRARITVAKATPGGDGFRLTGNEISERCAVDAFFGGHPCNAEVYDPGERQMIPEGGAWAMIRRQLPPLEGRLDRHFGVGRIFYLEQMAGTDERGFQPDGSYKARCRSPWGEVCLWPYEYAVQSPENLLRFWEDGEIIFHPMNLDSARFSDITFYARSRGIGLEQAAVMALGSVETDPDAMPVGWFEPRADLVPVMAAMAKRVNTSLAQHIAQNPRATN